MQTDVHQHLWPAPFLAALRARRTAPRMVGWTLELPGERPTPSTRRPTTSTRGPPGGRGRRRARVPRAVSGPGARPAARRRGGGARRRMARGRAGAPAAVPGLGDARGPRRAGDALARGAVGLELGADLVAAPAASGARAAARRARGGGAPAARAPRPGRDRRRRPAPAPLVGPGGPLRRASCTPHGGRGSTRAARCTRACPSASPPSPGSGRSTASAGAPAAAARWRSTRSPSWRPRATARRPSTP